MFEFIRILHKSGASTAVTIPSVLGWKPGEPVVIVVHNKDHIEIFRGEKE